jgi:Na+/melibiose symporter-like transporter
MHGAPQNRTSIAAAMVDTTDEVTSAVSTAVVGTIIAALFVGDFTSGHWSTAQHTQFEGAATLSVSILAVIAVILILWAFRRTRMVVVAGRQGDANTESDLAGDGVESK